MTDNQIKQMMNLMTKCVNGIQRLEENMLEVKSDVAELKTGQERLEKAMDTNNKALDLLAGDNIRIKTRVDVLEQEIPH